MKKMLSVLLLFAAGSLGVVSAQTRHSFPNNKYHPKIEERYGHNNHGFNNSMQERDERISRINRMYDQKIEAVKMNRFMRNRDKKREINALNTMRERDVREVTGRYLTERRNGFAYNNRKF